MAFGAALALRLSAIDPRYEERRTEDLEPEALQSPGATLLHILAIEHRLAASDLMWLQVVQELGKSTRLSSAAWDRVERWGAIAVDFDRRYFTVYHAVGTNLSVWGHRVDASDRFVKRGYRELPDRWELPLILGYNAYFVRGDARQGSDYILEASRLPGSPHFLASLSGRMRYHAGDEDGAIALLETMKEGLDGRAREEVETRLMLLRSERRMRLFDAACRRRLAEKGVTTTDAETLIHEGYVQEPPFDFFQGRISFDGDCVARSKMLKIREFEARERVGSFAKSSTVTGFDPTKNIKILPRNP